MGSETLTYAWRISINLWKDCSVPIEVSCQSFSLTWSSNQRSPLKLFNRAVILANDPSDSFSSSSSVGTINTKSPYDCCCGLKKNVCGRNMSEHYCREVRFRFFAFEKSWFYGFVVFSDRKEGKPLNWFDYGFRRFTIEMYLIGWLIAVNGLIEKL